MKQAKNPIGSVQTSLVILGKLKERNGASITQLTADLDVTKGSIHNHLTTLEENGMVVRHDGEFRLGLRLFEYGEHVRNQRTIYDIGRSEADQLAEGTGELANILVEERGEGIYLYRAKGDQALSLDTGVGARVHLHTTALGKAILAYLPEERVREIISEHGLPRNTENTITDREELSEQLTDIHDQGYAYDMEERAEGVRCVASPIITSDQTVRGAVSVAGPSSRMKGDRLHNDIPERVQKAANVISINLTYA